MWICSSRCAGATAWCNDYAAVQMCAVVLLYLQVACALVGSLGAAYTGIVLANLTLALFALIAIESGSQFLGRAYAGLLACSLVLDVVWFCLFTNEIRHLWNEPQLGKFGALSLKIMFWMQVAGSALRFVSSLLWCQMYRLGEVQGILIPQRTVSVDARIVNLRSGNIDCEPALLGISIYDQAAYSPPIGGFSHEDLPFENNGQRFEDGSQLHSPLLHEEPV